MKIKKFLCNVLVTAMVLSSIGMIGTNKVEAAFEDHYKIETVLTGEEGKNVALVKNSNNMVEIAVAETGVYDVEVASEGFGKMFYLFNQNAKCLVNFYTDDDDMQSDFRKIYFVKGKKYFLRFAYNVPNGEDFSYTVTVKKSNYDLDDNLNPHATLTASRIDREEGNHDVNEDKIGTIPGITWDKEKNTLKLENYKGNYVFIFSYYSYVVADSEDTDTCPVVTIEVVGDNYFENLESADYVEPAFVFNNVDAKFTGSGTINVSKTSLYSYDGEKHEISGGLIATYNGITIDGPTFNVDGNATYNGAIFASQVTMKSGELNVNSYNAMEFGFIGIASEANYGPIINANNLSLEGGSIFVKVEEYKGESSLVPGGAVLGGAEFLNVSDDVIIGIDANENLFKKDSDGNIMINTFACLQEGKEDCKISENVKLYVGQGMTKEKVNELVAKAKTDKPSVTPDVKPVVNGPKVGTKLSDKKFTYKVTKAGTTDGKNVGEVEITGLKNKKVKRVTIKSTVKINGVKYKVTSVGKKAFAKAKKLKKINIKAKYIKKFKKNAFKGLKKSCVIKVLKAKKKKYKKAIKKAGFKGKIK